MAANNKNTVADLARTLRMPTSKLRKLTRQIVRKGLMPSPPRMKLNGKRITVYTPSYAEQLRVVLVADWDRPPKPPRRPKPPKP